MIEREKERGGGGGGGGGKAIFLLRFHRVLPVGTRQDES